MLDVTDITRVNNGEAYLIKYDVGREVVYGFAKRIEVLHRRRIYKLSIATCPSISFVRGHIRRGYMTPFVANRWACDNVTKKEFKNAKIIKTKKEIDYFLGLLKKAKITYNPSDNFFTKV